MPSQLPVTFSCAPFWCYPSNTKEDKCRCP